MATSASTSCVSGAVILRSGAVAAQIDGGKVTFCIDQLFSLALLIWGGVHSLPGIEANNLCVYSAFGLAKTSAVTPASAISPLDMTIMRSQSWAATRKSWVTN